MDNSKNTVIQNIVDHIPKLTPKGRILGNYVVQHPYIGYMAAMSSVISYLVLERSTRQQDAVCAHQEKLEQIYMENDILFNLPMLEG